MATVKHTSKHGRNSLCIYIYVYIYMCIQTQHMTIAVGLQEFFGGPWLLY